MKDFVLGVFDSINTHSDGDEQESLIKLFKLENILEATELKEKTEADWIEDFGLSDNTWGDYPNGWAVEVRKVEVH